MAKVLWQTKNPSSNQYEDMPPMTGFGGEGNDLDKNSYRDIVQGNFHRPVILGKGWTKSSHTCDHLSDIEFGNLLARLRVYPLHIKIRARVWNTEWYEFEGYCAKYSWNMNQDGTWKVSFNLVQGKRTVGM